MRAVDVLLLLAANMMEKTSYKTLFLLLFCGEQRKKKTHLQITL